MLVMKPVRFVSIYLPTHSRTPHPPLVNGATLFSSNSTEPPVTYIKVPTYLRDVIDRTPRVRNHPACPSTTHIGSTIMEGASLHLTSYVPETYVPEKKCYSDRCRYFIQAISTQNLDHSDTLMLPSQLDTHVRRELSDTFPGTFVALCM